MFSQILNFLKILVDVLKNGEKILTERREKKYILELIEVHELLSELKENAEFIQKELQILSNYDFYQITYPGKMNAIFKTLRKQFEKQYNLFENFFNPPNTSGKFHYFSLYDIYIHSNFSEEMRTLFHSKSILISILYHYMGYTQRRVSLPKSFDLFKIKDIENRIVLFDFNFDFESDCMIRDCFINTYIYDDVFGNKMKYEEMKGNINLLYSQILEFDTVSKLEKTMNEIAEHIRSNFSIEDLLRVKKWE